MINIDGLNASDRARIREIGIWKWMDELCNKRRLKFCKADLPAGHRCALGSKCFNAVKRQGAYVRNGNGLYCSATCRGAARANQLREKAGSKPESS